MLMFNQNPIGSQNQEFALYNSRSQIGSASTIQVGIGSTTVGNHNFIFKDMLIKIRC